MPNLKKKKPCPGSLRLTDRNQTCKTTSPSTSSISKYFKNQTGTSCVELFDTPYKNSLSKIQPINCSDDDFKTPPAVKKVPKILNKKETKRNTRKATKKKSTATIDSIFKRTKDNFEHLDVHPEHLQMAIAMSKSTYELENPNKRKDSVDESIPTFLNASDIPKTGTTLENYGFKSKRPKLEAEFKIERSVVRRKKNSRFRFVTPILLLRNSEERDALIQSKISLILSEQHTIDMKQELSSEFCSEILSEMLANENRIMRVNSLGIEELNCNLFIDALNIPRSEEACGCLLKSWSDIPGRDSSPDRSKSNSLEDIGTSQEASKKNYTKLTALKKITGLDISDQNSIEVKPQNKADKDEDKLDGKCNIDGESRLNTKEKESNFSNTLEDKDIAMVTEADMEYFSNKSPVHQELAEEQDLRKTESDSNETSNCNTKRLNISSKRSISPDLFDSDYESFSPKEKSPLKLFKSCTGIEHFESFTHNSKTLSQQFCSAKEDLCEQGKSVDLGTEPQSPTDSDCTVNYDLGDIENLDILSQEKFANNEDVIGNNDPAFVNNENIPVNATSNVEIPQNLCRERDEDEFAIDLTQSSDGSGLDDSEHKSQEFKELTSQEHGDNDILSQESVENDRNSEIELPSFRDYLRRSMHEDEMINLTQELSEDDTEMPEGTQNSTVSDTGLGDGSRQGLSFSEVRSVDMNGEDQFSLLSEPRSSYNRSDLNITEYIHQMLNTQDSSNYFTNQSNNNAMCTSKESIDEDLHYSSLHRSKSGDCGNSSRVNSLEGAKLTDWGNKTMSSNTSSADLMVNRTMSSMTSEESIVISDEELNYSSLHSKRGNCDLPDSPQKITCGTNETEEKLLVQYHSEDGILISDEEICSTSEVNYKRTTKCKKFYDLSDDEDMSKIHIDNIEQANLELRAKYSIAQSQVNEESEQNHVDTEDNKETDMKNQTNEEDLGPHPQIEFMEYLHNLEEYNIPTDQPGEYQENTDISSVDRVRSPQVSQALNVGENEAELHKSTTKDLVKTQQKNKRVPKEKADKKQSLDKQSMLVQKFTIKTRDVTPEPDYDRMTSPEIVKELRKIGVKALKRNRGIQFLKYIYECTHPIAGSEEAKKFCKIGKEARSKRTKRKASDPATPLEIADNLSQLANIEIIDGNVLESINPDDFILERKVSSKIPSCRLPLQVAWHNFISCNAGLKENILTYEPLQLEVIHSMLKEETGCKYHMEDLITYLDQKCITFRTSQSGPRTKKKL